MFTLIMDRPPFYRIKEGQSAELTEKTFSCPVSGEAFAGRIVPVSRRPLSVCRAQVGDSYERIATRLGVDGRELEILNGGKPVYPTCKLFVPSESTNGI